MILTDKEKEEFEAIRKTSQYHFYKGYVEQLEKDFDDLQDKYNELVEENKKLKDELQGIKVSKGKSGKYDLPVSQEDFQRLRNQNVLLKKKKDNFERLLEFREEEIKDLKKEIQKLKERR